MRRYSSGAGVVPCARGYGEIRLGPSGQGLTLLSGVVGTGGALAQARGELARHLEQAHPGLTEYLEPLHALGVDRVEDLAELEEADITSLQLKKVHQRHFRKACGRCEGACRNP